MASSGTGWIDEPESPAVIASLADRVAAQQTLVARGGPGMDGRIGRGQHQKQLLGALGTLTIEDSIPPQTRIAPFVPGVYKVACRISNGQPCPFHDPSPDVRGIALKFFAPGSVETDLVMTNEGGRSHARNAVEFTDVADVLAAFVIRHGTIDACKKLLRLLSGSVVAPVRAAHAAAILAKETVLHRVRSMTTEHYWGSVVKLGGAAVKYSLHPHPSTTPGTDANPRSPEYLTEDLRNRLAKGPLRYELSLQFFVSEESTPVNDASIAWRSPLLRLGQLVIPVLPSPDDEAAIDRMAFNPAHGFEPLGITHARKAAYATSARNRGAMTTNEARSYIAQGLEPSLARAGE